MRVFSGLDEVASAVGQHIGRSDWHSVTQEEVDAFAEATHDHQWIHVDVERASHGPFGAPIAHGFLTLSLLAMFSKQTYRVENIAMTINYGLNKVRFPQPVKVGSKVRASADLIDVTDVARGKQLVVRWTVEVDGAGKPACVADMVSRLIG